jgi:ABC-type Fe3+-hydroxamate transport system substrate-binding protein
MKSFTDQMGRTVEIAFPPRRIVSLVPSQSELLYDLGLANTIAGVTKFCIHPPGLRSSTAVIGGTKTLSFDKIRALSPDLIIGNKEENTQSEIEELEKEFPVWMSDIHDLDSALEMIRSVGNITSSTDKAIEISGKIENRFGELVPLAQPLSALYLIWRKPFMAAGRETFIDDCLLRCGLVNCLSESRYPGPDLAAIRPEVILLSSEPYPFAERHVSELKAIFPEARIELVDGEYFSWYGSRLLGAPDYFADLIKRLEAK